MEDDPEVQEALQRIKSEFTVNSLRYDDDIAARISSSNGAPLLALYGLFRNPFPYNNNADAPILNGIENDIIKIDKLSSKQPETLEFITSRIRYDIGRLSVEEKKYMNKSFKTHGQSLYKALNDYSKEANLGDIFEKQLRGGLEHADQNAIQI